MHISQEGFEETGATDLAGSLVQRRKPPEERRQGSSLWQLGQLELRDLSDQALLDQTRQLVAQERALEIAILRRLREIEARRLYAARGYESLFTFLVGALRLPKASAHQRISAMRALQEMPELVSAIEEGRLSVSVISQAQAFWQAQQKAHARARQYFAQQALEKKHEAETGPNEGEPATLLLNGENQGLLLTWASPPQVKECVAQTPTPAPALPPVQAPPATAPAPACAPLDTLEQKRALFQTLEGKSRREAERVLASLDPQPEPRERQRPLSGGKTELRIVISEELERKLNRIRDITAHRSWNPTFAELLEYMADEVLKRIDPIQKAQRAQARQRREEEKKEESLPVQLSPSPMVPASELPDHRCKLAGNTQVDSSVQPAELAGSVAPARSPETPALPFHPLADSRKLERNPGGPKRTRIAGVSLAVRLRDQDRCTFVDSLTGRRCTATRGTQVDHQTPVARGGKTSVEQCRVLCHQHNLYAAIQELGWATMAPYLRR